MMWFFQHFWIFISYHIFLLNQVEGAIAIPPSNSAPATLLSVRLSVCLSINRSVNHIFRFLHICWQVTGKEWHRVRNADVSRWLTLGQHWCRWVLFVISCVRPSVQPSMGLGLCIAYKALGRNGLQFGMLSACPTIWVFFFFLFFFLRLGLGQRRAVVNIGRWLLPSLVDMGDICCHYWQHILVVLRKNLLNIKISFITAGNP